MQQVSIFVVNDFVDIRTFFKKIIIIAFSLFSSQA